MVIHLNSDSNKTECNSSINYFSHPIMFSHNVTTCTECNLLIKQMVLKCVVFVGLSYHHYAQKKHKFCIIHSYNDSGACIQVVDVIIAQIKPVYNYSIKLSCCMVVPLYLIRIYNNRNCYFVTI